MTYTVKRVVGTGHPVDVILLIPIVANWQAARACGLEQDVPLPIGCDAPIGRILILEEPGLTDDQGRPQSTLAMCEPHYQSWLASTRADVA